MTVAYHLWLDEQAKGPFTIGQLRAMWSSGQLTAENPFSTDGGQEWHYLSGIIGELEPQQIVVPDVPKIDRAAIQADFDKEVREAKYQGCLAQFLAKGWMVVSEGSTGAQLQEPKGMSAGSKACLILGVVFLPLGVGLILIICALVGHVCRKPKMEFIPRDDSSNLSSVMKNQALISKQKARGEMDGLIVLGLIVLMIGGLVLYAYIGLNTK